MDQKLSVELAEKAFGRRQLASMLKVSVAAAREAGKVQAKYFRRKIQVSEKEGAGLVTEVDLRSEELILKQLRKKFPSIPIIGEESGLTGTFDKSGPAWHVDPLDGTTNYAHGFPMYGVSIGLAIGDVPILGVVHAPSLRETWYASAGGGAFLNKEKIRTSSRDSLKESLLATGFAYTKGAPLRLAVERFRHLSMRARAVRRPGAAALDLAFLAMGTFDGFWETQLNSWDVCAGVCLVREAGGIVTNFSGESFRFAERELIGSNGVIHRPMIQVLKTGLDSFERDGD